MKKQIVGQITQGIIDLTGISLPANTPIMFGQTNLDHMKEAHPDDFEKYGDRLDEILSTPDYVAKHPRKDSIEYIKIYHDHVTNEHVLVAVRASGSGVIYARSLFVMTEKKVQQYQDKGAFKKL